MPLFLLSYDETLDNSVTGLLVMYLAEKKHVFFEEKIVCDQAAEELQALYQQVLFQKESRTKRKKKKLIDTELYVGFLRTEFSKTKFNGWFTQDVGSFSIGIGLC